ncbi:hypothetical protein CPB85DRAFT_128202 [Mucidula mucida]|nr:hypothetical protein CPB85DRAFT_128202 [Mucidula mucida]
MARIGRGRRGCDAIRGIPNRRSSSPTRKHLAPPQRAGDQNGIVAALRRLGTDESIIKDKSAIIVFYAGHGASSPKPAEWEDWATSGGQLEMLCPVDMGELNEANQEIEGIPDRTISALLDEISQEKGNNIVRLVVVP